MKSYAVGEQIPLLETTIHKTLDETVARLPDHPALISLHQSLRLNYRQLQEHSARVAAGLWALGVRPGDRVGMWASSCAEWVYLQVATSRIGAVLVNVNPAYRELDLRYILKRSRMKVILLHEQDQRTNYLGVLDGARDGQDLTLEGLLEGRKTCGDLIVYVLVNVIERLQPSQMPFLPSKFVIG